MDRTVCIIAAVSIILDQLTKFFAQRLTETIVLIPKVLQFHLVHNSGSLFGLFPGSSSLLIWFSIMVIGFFLFYHDQMPETLSGRIFVGLVLGGVIGNLIDRVRFGFVIDFVDVPFYSVFNIADASLSVGILGLVWYLWE